MIILFKAIIFTLILFFLYYKISIGYDYVKDIYKATGIIAIITFFISILLPNKFIVWIKYFGKISLLFACLHFFNFIFFDTQLNIKTILYNFLSPRNLIGFSAIFIMTMVFFKKYFNLLNTALFLACLHYAMSVKIPEIIHYCAILLSFLLLFKDKK
ncbi:hypothetical protein [Campylobacter sp. MG1]|uniref:hypothetical protein n=1 Tax=Campylobacter sp. MG1 TaxID=2976332 RepID=UPI00226C78EA|nr:hypothetical protein [Campylobacter sp. MG1]